MMRKIYVIGSQKGGVGKTTSTLNLAYALQKQGKKVLTVDFDSQTNLTACYGIENTGEEPGAEKRLYLYDGGQPCSRPAAGDDRDDDGETNRGVSACKTGRV